MTIAIPSKGKCGLSKCITSYLVSMAAVDLMVVLTCVLLNRIIGVYFPGSFLSITSVYALKTSLVYAARASSVWLTVTFTFDRYVAICWQKLKCKYCTQTMGVATVGTICALSSLRNVPWYFALRPLYINNNVPFYCNVKSNFYAFFPWIALSYLNQMLTRLVPLFLNLLLNALTARSIFIANRVRSALHGKKSGEDKNDPEMEDRRKSIILLLAVSTSFMLLWMTFIVRYLYVRIANPDIYTGYSEVLYILQEAGYLLLLLSCCTNTCIYVVTQSKFRKDMKHLMKYLYALLYKMVKQ